MRLRLEAHVHTADGLAGTLADVVIDPVKKTVTHVVVRAGDPDPTARLVPLQLVAAEDALSCTKEEFEQLDSTVGCVVLDESGAIVAAAGTRILRISDGEAELLAVTGDDPDIRFNDGACDARGRLWVGTMADDEGPGRGSLYRLDERGLEKVLSPVSISNGIDWSLDGRTMYYADSTDLRVYAFDFDVETGQLATQRTFIELDEGEGFPDGLTVDAEGCVWLAIWDGWRVRRYGPDGEILGEFQLPVARPTSCAFGGSDLGALLITSAYTRLDEAELAAQPDAGAVFAVRPGVGGRPANRFRNA